MTSRTLRRRQRDAHRQTGKQEAVVEVLSVEWGKYRRLGIGEEGEWRRGEGKKRGGGKEVVGNRRRGGRREEDKGRERGYGKRRREREGKRRRGGGNGEQGEREEEEEGVRSWKDRGKG